MKILKPTLDKETEHKSEAWTFDNEGLIMVKIHIHLEHVVVLINRIFKMFQSIVLCLVESNHRKNL